ncbi:MAG: tRNA (N(6)-L-threonylcarbamoyladenosine(37)-C(2))-methylthiotransferase MtaB [Lachnospiraceae bacterium]
MKSVALHNLGCKVNAYEIEVMQQKLTENGYQIVPFAPGADIYIINTCTVTNIADRKSRQMLHKAKKMNPDAIVVATGCYVQTGEDTVTMDACIDLAIGNNRKKDIVSILEQYFEEHDKTLHHTTIIDINHTDEYEEMELKKTAEHTRAYIKIQDGCNQFCSYCIIPYARGRVRSRKPEDVIKEVRGLVKEGYREIVITGIHLSSYGLDFLSKDTKDYLEGAKDIREAVYKKEFLLKLLKQIHEIEGLKRIRLGSLEPRIITEHFAQELSNLPKICPHFHLSLQSGCDEVLKRMNRHYSTDEYYEKVEILRKYFNDPAITTDIITGFPQESAAEFEETVAFAKKVCFYEMHIFKYSRRQGTVAAAMEGQLTEQEKANRSNVLIELEREQSKEFRKKRIGTKITVLLEEQKMIDGKTYMIGHTPEYIQAAFETEEDLSNQVIEGTATEFLTDEILLLSERSQIIR